MITKKFPYIIESTKINTIKDTHVVVDANYIIMATCIAYRKIGQEFENNDGKSTAHIKAMLDNVVYYLKHNIIPIYVFDGKAPNFKQDTLNKRKHIKNTAKTKCDNATSMEEYLKYYKQTVELGNNKIKDVKYLLDLIGIPYVQSLEEADPQIAEITKHKQIYGAMSDDIDIILFGGKTLVRRKKDKLSIIHLDSLLDALSKYYNHKITHNNLIDIVILFGSEYLDGIKQITSNKLLKMYKDNNFNISATIQYMENNDIVISKEFKQKWNNIKEYFLYPRIIKYSLININLKSPDFDILYKYLYTDNQFNEDRVNKCIDIINNIYKKQ